jgi:hypothetical protein
MVMVSSGSMTLLIFYGELRVNQPTLLPSEVMPRLLAIQSNYPSTIRGVSASTSELSSTADPLMPTHQVPRDGDIRQSGLLALLDLMVEGRWSRPGWLNRGEGA